jgi:hypothetical protein
MTDSSTTTATGPATHHMLQELHRLLVAELTARLTEGRPPAELLLVARRVLKDNGLLGLGIEQAERERLEALYREYVKRLSEAVFSENPSAAVLAEARLFIQSQGVAKDLCAAADTATALTLLQDQRLPFKQ